MKNLTILTCDIEDRCFQRRDVTNNNNGVGITYRSSGLTSCTSYYLAINTEYPGVELDSRKIAVVTRFDESKGHFRNYSAYIHPKYTKVEINVDHESCIDSFFVHSQLISGENKLENMMKRLTPTAGIVTVDELRPNSYYHISMTGIITLESGEEKNVSMFENLSLKTSMLIICYLARQ